ncbi:unnamed protein product, partial [Prorocentrum cordatum]
GKSKHKHIFVYHQRPDIPNEVNEPVDNPKGEPRTMITTGEHEDMRIKSHAVYFLRNVPDQKPVKMDIASDGELLFGEVAASPLESLSAGLMSVFRPIVSTPRSIDWAACDNEQATEFCTVMDRFSTELSDGIKSLSSGIDLPCPDAAELEIQRWPMTSDAAKDH